MPVASCFGAFLVAESYLLVLEIPPVCQMQTVAVCVYHQQFRASRASCDNDQHLPQPPAVHCSTSPHRPCHSHR